MNDMKRLSVQKIKQYLERPDGELDLHGLRQDEAMAELADFLHKAERLGWERVKIITGRGLNSPDGRGVLRDRAEAFLRSHNYRFQAAKLADGGAGCLMVDIA